MVVATGILFLFSLVSHGQPALAWVSLVARPVPVSPRLNLVLRSTTSMGGWEQGADMNEEIPPLGDGNEDEPTDDELEASLGEWDERVASFNTLHLVGRVGNSPEPRYFDDGNVVVNLSLGCKRKLHFAERQAEDIKSGDEETDWYGLEIWGQTAEFVSKFVDKGARVGVIGSLQVDEWQDKESGEKRTKAKVVVRDFDILESKAEAEMRRSNQRGPSFYTSDDDDQYKSSSKGVGGFFD